MPSNTLFIIGSDRKWEEEQLLQAGEAAGHHTSFVEAGSVRIFLETHGAKVVVDGHDMTSELQSSRIIFRRTRGAQDTMIALALLADHWGITYTDSIISILSNLNKLHSMPAATLKHIQNIPTVFLRSEEVFMESSQLDCSLPFLAKPVCGRHGEGVKILESESELTAYLQSEHGDVMLQACLSIDEEYRVFVLGNDVLGVIKKIPEKGSRVANYAAGAEFHETEVPDIIAKEAVELCSQQKIDIGGVDLARVGETYYLLEVNRCPEFRAFTEATNIPVAEHLVKFISSK